LTGLSAGWQRSLQGNRPENSQSAPWNFNPETIHFFSPITADIFEKVTDDKKYFTVSLIICFVINFFGAKFLNCKLQRESYCFLSSFKSAHHAIENQACHFSDVCIFSFKLLVVSVSYFVTMF
jgi:hypothetical protein